MRLSVLLAAIMMIVMLLSPVALADGTEAYHLVITYPDAEYDVGSEVTVTVHVFEKAKYVSVDNVTLLVGAFMDMRTVDLEETATGKWTGTFTITEDDVSDLLIYKIVSMFAEAMVNVSTVAEGYASMMILVDGATEDRLVVTNSIDPPGVYIGPGETKTITWEFRHDGELVDPDTIEGDMFEAGSFDNFEPTRTSTGVYTYDYTMPNGPRSVQTDLNIQATYDTGTDTLEGESDVDLYMNFLHVWAKKDGVSATTASFDLFVSNLTGVPVEAASITLDYSYDDDNSNWRTGSTNGTTDADGRANIELTYNDLGDQATDVEVEGRVIGQGKEQALSFSIRVRAETDEPDDPEPLGFDVVPEKDMLSFDKDVNLPATAYYDGQPLNSGTIYWYAYTPHAVLNKGETTTSVVGAFSADFRTPNKGTMDPTALTTHFQAPIEDGTTYYYDDSETLALSSMGEFEPPDSPYDALHQFKDGAVKVSVGKLEKNKDVPVTVSYNKADREWMVAVIVGNDPNPANMGLVPTWTYWTTSFMEGAYGDLCSLDGGDWKTTIFLPENLPNKDFYVGGLCVNQNLLLSSLLSGDMSDYIKTNYVTGLEIGQSGSSGGEGGNDLVDSLMEPFLFGIPLLYWIFILVIIVVLGIVVGLMSTKKREPEGMEEPGLEPATEGPSFDGGPGPAAMPMPPPSYDAMQPVPGQADYGIPPPPAPAQPEYAVPVQPEYGAPAQPEYAVPVQPEYAAPPQPEYAAPPQPEYAAPPQPEYAAPAQPEYAAPPQPEYAAPAQPMYAVPPQPAAPPPPPPGYPEPAPPAPAPAPEPAPPPQPAAPPMAPPPTPAAPPAPAPAAPPAPAPAAPPAAAPAATAPAADPGATMTIRCQKCQTTLTIPRKRPIKVTCPNCGASGVLR